MKMTTSFPISKLRPTIERNSLSLMTPGELSPALTDMTFEPVTILEQPDVFDVTRDTESHTATIAREYTAPALSTTALVLSR